MSHSMPHATGDAFHLSLRQQRGNVARLTIVQALAGANSIVIHATGYQKQAVA